MIARWRAAPRHHASFEESVLANRAPALRLETWVRELTGPLTRPLQDISGGAWRQIEGHEDLPADPRMERRKFRAFAEGGKFLVKFAGLGGEGVRKLQTARTLHEAGFAPQPLGLCHGFLVEQWIEAAPLSRACLPREKLVERLASYLALRQSLPAFGKGASLAALAAMARHNVREALGEAAARRLDTLPGLADRLQPRARPVNTDNRMHGFEWLVAPGGHLVKTDALDHSGAHDIVGCQDIAWDVAGAIVEHALDRKEATRLLHLLDGAGAPADPELVEFMMPCHLAFQLGLWSLAASANGGEDSARAAGEARKYASLVDSFRGWSLDA
jgi:hypothetical protein